MTEREREIYIYKYYIGSTEQAFAFYFIFQICKHFLDAVENSKYGWFWNCPNGAKCIYRHALPPGFVLKRDQKLEEKEEKISLEDLIEREVSFNLLCNSCVKINYDVNADGR